MAYAPCKEGNVDYKFEIKGKLVTPYTTNTKNCQSSTGYSVFLINGAPVSQKSSQQKSVMLSMAESELVAGTQWAQYIYSKTCCT
jgi:hypothetical protein